MARNFLPGSVTGDAALDEIGLRFDRLLDNGVLRTTVTSDGAEGDDITVEIRDNAASPAVDAYFLSDGWRNGMGGITLWPATNTGAVTIAVNGGAPMALLTPSGGAVEAGQLPSGLLVQWRYWGGDLIVVSPIPASDSGPQARYFFKLISSQTWVKPVGLGDDTAWNVLGWGAGGGGSSGASTAGGGGGACQQGLFRHGDLPSSVAVTIAAGGAVNANGGNTTFGSLLTALGGGRAVSAGGGAGAGLLGAGVDATPGAMGGGATGEDASLPDAGAGGASSTGGRSVRGGAGGGSTGGVSLFGGNGGGTNTPGDPRGGGGGRNAVGGRGELLIWN